MSTQRRTPPFIKLSPLCLAVGAALAACDSDLTSEAELEVQQSTLPELDDEKYAPADPLLERYTQRLIDSPPTEMAGIVTSLDGAPIEGVKVTLGDHEALTDAAGEYRIDGVEVGSYVLGFDHPDHVFAQRRVTIEQPEPGWLPQRLMPRSRPQRVNAEAVTVIRQGPLTLEFEPGDLEFERTRGDVHGPIDAVVTVIEPGVLGHLDAAPAELEGLTVDGAQVGLFSYGMVEVELSQAGQKINVRRGQTVKASMVVSDSATPPGDAIPMWHHDTTLGIWAQERGVDAQVEKRRGIRLAIAELPHFSAWNYDSINDGVCAPFVVPAKTNVTRVRVTSTFNTGVEDGIWSMSFDCATASGLSTRCGINVPAGNFGSEVYFKIQAQTQGSTGWCDLNLALNGNLKGVWSRSDVNTYLANNNLSGASWCGTMKPTGPWVMGNFAFPLSETSRPNNIAVFGVPQSSPNCSVVIGANAVGNSDPGFSSMAANAVSPAYKNDYDADGIADKSDKCIGNKSPDQSDGDGDGYGNLCEKACYVAPSTPNAVWYDADADGIDDYCDDKWNGYNPSQY